MVDIRTYEYIVTHHCRSIRIINGKDDICGQFGYCEIIENVWSNNHHDFLYQVPNKFEIDLG